MTKKIIAVGRVHPPLGNFRLREMEWLDDEDQRWFDLDPLPRIGDKEAWDYLDGEVLE